MTNDDGIPILGGGANGAGPPSKYTGMRTCVFCARSFTLPLPDGEEERWSAVQLDAEGHLDENLIRQPPPKYHRCPDCTAEDRTEPARRDGASIIGDATHAALDVAADRIGLAGGRVLAGFVAIHCEDLEPNAGMYFVADEKDGPDSPADMLAFVLNAAQGFAAQHDLPFVMAEMPGEPGQG